MSSKALLKDLVRASVEFDAAALFWAHLRDMASGVQPNFELCTIAGALCEYAQTGTLVVPGVPYPDTIVLATRLTEALFYPAIETPTPAGDPWWWTRIYGTSSLAIVLRSSVARHRLSTLDQSVPTAFLASLASVSPGRVRQLVSTHVLAASHVRHGGKVYTLVDGHSARTWLASHGIAPSSWPC